MGSLEGRVIGITADRRWEEQADLFRKRGASVVHGPTMRTIDLTADPGLRDATDAITAAPPDWLVVSTGGGARSWFDVSDSWGGRDSLIAAFRDAGTKIVCRGAKGVSAVRGAGLDVTWRAEHESMAEVVEYLRGVVASGETVALQLFDPDDHWATAEIRALAGRFIEIPVYQWRVPDDIEPARALARGVADRTLDAVTFTSQPAVRFLFTMAADAAVDVDAMRAAFETDVLAVCVGPVCAEALVECGVQRTVWPDPPRLVPMVKLAETHLSNGG